MESKDRFKYWVKNSKGELEEWTGMFQNRAAALEWFEKYGKNHEARGHTLVLKRCSKNGR